MAESYSVEAILRANVSNFVSGIKQAKSEIDNLVSNNKQTFDSFSQVGKAATVGGAAIAAGLGGAVKIAADFQSGMSNVQAISGASSEDMVILGDKAREMGSKTKFSATQASEAFSYMAMAGWKTTDMLDGIAPVMDLAAASGEDLALTADILTDGLTAFGLTAKDGGRFADVMAAASSNANTNVAMLGESFKYVAPLAGAMGYSVEDTSLALGLMANAGVKGSQAGTSLKTMFTNLAKPTKAMKGAMDDLGISLTNSDGSMKSMEEVIGDLRTGFSGLDEAQQANYAATIFGKEAMAGALAVINASEADYNKLKTAINNSEGAASEMAATMQDNLSGSVTNLKSALEEVAIAIGTALIPYMQKAVDFAQMLADKFNGLDDKTKKTIAVIAALAAGFLLLTGPILMLIGFIPSLLAGFAALTTVVAAIGGAIAAVTAPAWLAVAAVVAIGVAGVVASKTLSEDAIPAIERFADGVSENTQKAVGAFMDMSEEANVALKEMAWGQEVVTKEMAVQMKEQQQEITDVLLTAISERQAQEKELAREQMANIQALSDEQKNGLIEKLNERFAAEATTVEEGNAQIQEIYERASNNNRRINQEESDLILEIRQSMTEQAVRIMSENEEEQRLIYERMKDNASVLTALEAAEVAQNAIEKRDAVVAEAEAQYTETRMWAEQQRDETGLLSAAEAAAVIAEAQKKRDNTIAAAEEMHTNVITEAQSQADEHVALVDWETGEIKSKWQVMKDNISEKMTEISISIATKSGEAYVSMSSNIDKMVSVTKTGFSLMSTSVATKMGEIALDIYTKWTKARNDTKTNVDGIKLAANVGFTQTSTTVATKMSEIALDIYTKWTKARNDTKTKIDEIRASASDGFEKVKNAVKDKLTDAVRIVGEKIGEMPGKVTAKMGEMAAAGGDLIQGLINGILGMAAAAVEAIAGVVGGVVSKAKSMLKIKSPSRVFMAIGRDTVKGLEVGIDKRRVHAKKSVDALFASVMQSTKEGFKKERAEIQQNNAEMKKIEQRSAEDILRIKQKAAQKKKALTSAELIKIRRIEEDAAKKLQSLREKNNKIELDMNDKQMKEFLSASEKYVENKRKNGQMSLADEVYFWNAMYKNAKKGSEQYEIGMKNHQAAVKSMRSQIESTNKEYTDKMLAIDKEYTAESQKLQDEVMKAREKQMDQLTNFVGIFDKFEKKTEESGTDLVNNLFSQLVALEEYDEVINQLGSRIKDKELLAHLKSMGVKSLGELQALNTLSDYELQAYANIYQEKFKLAAKHTEKEMRPMVSEVNQQLVEMSEQANKRLEELNQEWRKKIKRIVNGVDKEFDSMHQVGIDAMAGLGSGMASMNKDLQRQAERIADTIKKTIKNAFDINSPSRWMHNMVGKNMMIGWIDGMESMRGRVNKVASSMAEAAKVNLSSDMPNQINAINRQANKQMQTDFANNFSVDKQPAVINVHVGSHQIAQEIVDDISSLQASQYNVRRSSYGL